jgi:alpha-D-ribose 1-methylphosphonate 5-triphosphate diphosphatase
MQTSVIRNAIVVQPDSTVTHGGVLVAGETIQTVLDDDSACQREIANGALSIDAQGAFLMPGVVDLHNDALEFEINPRPGASLPLPFAFDNL